MRIEALSESELTKLFRPSKSNPEYIHGRESTTIEYKQSYNHGGMAQYFKTMASFANADGGYIIFGIGDSPRVFLGLTEKAKNQFDNIKIEEFTQNLNEYFQPEIKWGHAIFEYRDKFYGVIYTYALSSKPCICSKNFSEKNGKLCLEEGDIYYRYRARSQKIRYAELNNIFNQSREQEAQKWRKLIEHTAKIGISNASILNLNNGEMVIGNSMVIMDEELINKIQFIKEGSFVEKEGAPAIRLIGNVENITTYDGVILTAPKLRAIEQEDVVRAFLKNSVIEAPFEFIKIIMNCNSGFQPIYYYIKQHGSTINEIIDYIEESQKSSQTIRILLERLKGRKEEKQILSKNDSESYLNKMKYLEKWEKQKIEEIKIELEKKENNNWFLQSFFLIDDATLKQEHSYFKETLFELYEEIYKSSRSNIAGLFRRVLCRLDEVLYFD